MILTCWLSNIAFYNSLRKLALSIIILLAFHLSNGQDVDWAKQETYFQVYSFTDKVMGLTIELETSFPERKSAIDLVFEKIAETDSLNYIISQPVKSCIPIDTRGKFKFYKNKNLEEALLKGANRSFYVFCTKGVVQRSIRDVVFSLDMCKSNILVFRFDAIDFKKYGRPVICSTKKLSLTFGNFPAIDREVEKAIEENKSDYKDVCKLASFAKAGKIYLLYRDDFKWNLSKDSKCNFPARLVYTQERDKKIYRTWVKGLDLFGIPCD